MPHIKKRGSTKSGSNKSIQRTKTRDLCITNLDGIPSPAWQKDKRGIFLAANQALSKLIGKTPEEIIGRHDTEFFGEKLGRKLHKQDLEIIESGKSKQVEMCFHMNGNQTWVDSIITPYFDEKGVPAGTIGIGRITNRKQVKERILRTQRMESLGILASVVAHDLNNILGPISMAVSMLDENIKQDSNRELVCIIKEAAQRGTDIVNQVLAFSRGTCSQRKPLEPRLLVKQIERILQKVMPKSINFVTKLSNTLYNINGDPTQLHQVFMNLCVNARDAMPSGGTLTLSACNTHLDMAMVKGSLNAQPGHYLCITVADTGVGIPEEIREKIFDPFFTTKEIGKGTGLGLSTALAIIKNHEGFITLDSEVGKGSLFSVYFPATKKPLPPQKTETSPPFMRDGESIIIADDELPKMA